MKIKKLPQETINKIAAGEVIVSLANLIKEMVENSIDANSSSIQIKLNLKENLIEVIDNGDGIDEEDLDLLCERHCTSKSLNDNKYGFRGEALASISLISEKIRVKSKKNFSEYLKTKLANKNSCSIVKGAHFTIYNANLKLNVKEVLGVISKYAICNEKISFEVCVDNKITRIQQFKTKSEMVKKHFSLNTIEEFENDFCKFFFTHPSIHLKKSTFILFVNNRLVDNFHLKQIIFSVYENLLPKGAYPAIYIELNLKDVDVNVHPAKRIVLFDEEKIGLLLKDVIMDCIKKNNVIVEINKNVKIGGSPRKIYVDAKNEQLTNMFFEQSLKNEVFEENLENFAEKIKSEIKNEDFLMKNAILVGATETELFVQHEQSLIMFDLEKLKREFFYQDLIFDYQNYSKKPVKIKLENEVKACQTFGLIDLSDDKENLIAIPVKYGIESLKNWEKLEINEQIIRQVANILAENSKEININLLFQEMKKKLLTTEEVSLLVKELTTLSELYKVFERC